MVLSRGRNEQISLSEGAHINAHKVLKERSGKKDFTTNVSKVPLSCVEHHMI
jgi:hypothetical protein